MTWFYTDTADNEHFRSPTITIPSVQLFVARQPCVFARVLRRTSVLPVGLWEIHILCSYRRLEGELVVGFKRWRRRLERGLGIRGLFLVEW